MESGHQTRRSDAAPIASVPITTAPAARGETAPALLALRVTPPACRTSMDLADSTIITSTRSGSTGDALPPAPWVNVVGNPVAGFVVSESGTGTTGPTTAISID